MSKTFLEINREIASLQAQAAIAKNKEIGDVIRRMKEAIAVYGITAKDLGLDTSSPPSGLPLPTLQSENPNRRGRKIGFRMPAKVKTLPATSKAPKFQDDKGGTWAGVGNRPDWLKKALAAGKSLNDFLVGAAPAPVKTFQAAPLLSAQAANTVKFMKIPQDTKPAKSIKIPKPPKFVKPIKVKTPAKKVKALKVPAPEAIKTADAVIVAKVSNAVRIPKAKPASPSAADVAAQIALTTQPNKGIIISKAAKVPENPQKPKNLLKLPKSPLGPKLRSTELAKSVNIDLTNGPGSGAAKIIKTPIKAEFMDPVSRKTWSGRGGRPDWFSKLITSGKTYEELRVKQPARTSNAS